MLAKIKAKHIREIIIYIIVGLAAWATQSLLYIVFVDFGLFPSVAMIIATLLAFLVSYTGHVFFTFRVKTFIFKQFIKSLSNALFTILINVIIVRLITKVLLLNPHYAIFPTLLTPGISFLISKFWVFK